MCELINKYNKETFTGYKIVYKKGNRYFSPVVPGVEYKEGENIKGVSREDMLKMKNAVHENSYWVVPATIAEDKISGSFYEPNMFGKTAVFQHHYDAMNVSHQRFETIVKMTIGGNLMIGRYNYHCNIIAGSKIIKIEEL